MGTPWGHCGDSSASTRLALATRSGGAGNTPDTAVLPRGKKRQGSDSVPVTGSNASEQHLERRSSVAKRCLVGTLRRCHGQGRAGNDGPTPWVWLSWSSSAPRQPSEWRASIVAGRGLITPCALAAAGRCLQHQSCPQHSPLTRSWGWAAVWEGTLLGLSQTDQRDIPHHIKPKSKEEESVGSSNCDICFPEQPLRS